MWQDILKINAQPTTKHAKSRYVKRLVIRFLEQVPDGQPFSAHTVLNFYHSPEQEQHKNINDWEPNILQIVYNLIRQGVSKKKVRVGLRTLDKYSKYDLHNISTNEQSLFVVGNWPKHLEE